MCNLCIKGGLQNNLRDVRYVDEKATVFFKLKKTIPNRTTKWPMPKGINVTVGTKTYRFKVNEKNNYTYRTKEHNLVIRILRNSCRVAWSRYNYPKKYTVVRRGRPADVLYGNLTPHEKHEMKERYRAVGGDVDKVSSDLT